MQTNRTGVNEARLGTARKGIAGSGLPKTGPRPPTAGVAKIGDRPVSGLARGLKHSPSHAGGTVAYRMHRSLTVAGAAPD